MADPTSLLSQGWTLLQQGRAAEALAIAEAVLRQQPANISGRACRGMALWEVRGENEISLADLAWAVAGAPNAPQLRHNYGMLLSRAGRVEGAAEQFREVLTLEPADTVAFWGLMQNSRAGADDPLIAAMAALSADPSLSGQRRQFLAFGLAKAFDDLGEPEKAMSFAKEGNGLQNLRWDPRSGDEMVSQVQQLAADARLRRLVGSGHPSRAPLFVVGMPRSGTTLIETILSRHPKVLALGESHQVPEVLVAAWGKFGRDQGIGVSRSLPRDWLKGRAEQMAQAWSGRRSDVAVVTDKMPDNAFGLALIAQLFPKARVIYVRRHPLDTGVSNYLTRFADGQAFSTRLDWIGRRTRQLADSMAAWKQGLDLGILDVSYERLVSEPETQIRRIADFAGLAWTDELTSPEKSERSVRTASQWQVRQPIYRSSIARWKRYERWLGPMIDAMGGMAWVEAQLEEALAAR